MLLRKNVSAVFAICWPVLAVAALLIPAPAQAQMEQDLSTAPAQKEGEKPKDKKQARADREKAQAEVKKLQAEMDRLGKQMHQTREKLRKAYAALGEKEGASGAWTHRHMHRGMFGRHHHTWRTHTRFASRHFGVGMRHPGWGPHSPHAQHRLGRPTREGHSGLEQKVDRLQKEVEQLRQELRKGK